MTVSAAPRTEIALLATGITNRASFGKQPKGMQLALAKYDEILNTAIKKFGGVVFSTPGNALFAAFDNPSEALMAAYTSQAALSDPGLNWIDLGLNEPLGVSMAVHFGEVAVQNNKSSGPNLDKLRRIQAVGAAGTILVSPATREKLGATTLPENINLVSAGEHRLQDLTPPMTLYRVVGAALPQDPNPVKSLENWPQNLPFHTSSLIGREKEVSQAVEMLTRQNTRLITFTGPGGTGKTRLSLQVAADMLFDFPDGVFVVELAGIQQASQVAMAINRTLGLKEVSGRELLENLKNYLRERQVLLVLDNFEQIVSAAPLVSELLAAAPRMKVLVSSRIVLKIYGEQEFQVPPLELPGLGKANDMKELAAVPAVQLLLERVRQVLPNFKLTEQNASIMAQICARLDGLPLAIELAAVRFKMFKPEIILSGLTNRLQLLVNEADGRTSRQQTLRGAIDWSYNLLDETEKVLFARLGIFAGGFTAEVAERVCNPDYDPDFDTLDDLTSLSDHSLVRFLTPPGEDEPRFGMLETIREFALEKLKDSGESEYSDTRRHYASYFLALAEEAEPELTGRDQIEWYQRLTWEYPNFREVIEQALQEKASSFDVALRITSALWRFWTARGYTSEGREWLGKVLIRNSANPGAGSTDEKASVAVSAKGYTAAGLLALEEGDLNQAKAMLEEALRLNSLPGSQENEGSKAGLINTLNALGTVESYLGDFEKALEYHQRCLKLRRDLKDTRGIAISLCNLGALEAAQAQYDQARKYYEEALSLLRRVGDKRTMALLLNNLGNLWLTQDQPDQATHPTEESLRIYRELEDQGGIALALMQSGDIARFKNEMPAAIDFYRQSLVLFEEVSEKADLPPCFEGLAAALAATGNSSLAARLYGVAHKLRETLDLPLQPADLAKYEQELTKLKQQLSGEEFSKEWTAGGSLNIEEAFKTAQG